MSLTKGNRLLDSLPGGVRAALGEWLEPEYAGVGHAVQQPGAPIAEVRFPIDAVISLIAVSEEGHTAEIGSVGREGCTSAQAMLGADTAMLQHRIQIAGTLLAMPSGKFVRLTEELPALRELVERYIVARTFVLGQSIACHTTHAIAQRCARWLLETLDRVDGNEFSLTHELLASMLGVRRPAVTVVTGRFQAMGLIAYRRGRVRVVDRPGLEATACACYRLTAAAYARVTNP
jgi:CRP-like cAMP-binding protein